MSDKMIFGCYFDQQNADTEGAKLKAKGYTVELESTSRVMIRAADAGGQNQTIVDVDDEIWIVLARK